VQARFSRLLIPPVLVAVVCGALVSAAHAMPRASFGSDVTSMGAWHKQHSLPLSGEPDVGDSKNPPVHSSLVASGEGAPDARVQAVPEWLQMIGRIWMARYLGVR